MGTGSFPGGKVRPGRAADHSPPSSAAVMEEYSYTSTHPLGHTGSVRGSLYLYTSSCGPGSSAVIEIDYGLDCPGSNPCWDAVFCPSRPPLGPTQPPVKWVPSLSQGVKCGRSVLLTTHPLLVPRSWKIRIIPLPTLWTTPGLYRDHFNFTDRTVFIYTIFANSVLFFQPLIKIIFTQNSFTITCSPKLYERLCVGEKVCGVFWTRSCDQYNERC